MCARRYSYRILPAIMLVLVITLVPACGGGGDSSSNSTLIDNEGARDDANTPLDIIGSPNTSAFVNTEYLFQPTTIVSNGDSVSFDISNKPQWASFDSDTGRLSGVPTDVHVGTDSKIVISVSTGIHTKSLSSFKINVATSAANRTASLTWLAPVTNSNGTTLALSEIAGYRIYSGKDSTKLTLKADIQDGSTTTFTATGLASGVNYYSVTAYDFSNNESQHSNTATKTLP